MEKELTRIRIICHKDKDDITEEIIELMSKKGLLLRARSNPIPSKRNPDNAIIYLEFNR